jgi:hypothetical protein
MRFGAEYVEAGTPSSASFAAARAPEALPAIAILRPTRSGLICRSTSNLQHHLRSLLVQLTGRVCNGDANSNRLKMQCCPSAWDGALRQSARIPPETGGAEPRTTCP